MCRPVLFLFSFLLGTALHAQRVSAYLDRDKILLGEQVTLTLQADDINPRLLSLGWFSLPDTFNHVEVVKREVLDSANTGGVNTYIQKITLTSFDSGRWQLPELSITLTDNATGKQAVIKAPPVFLEVLPVDVSGMKDYHPVKDIIEVEARSRTWLIIVLAAGGVVLLFLLWWFLFRNKKSKPAVVKPADNLTNYQRLLKQVEQLRTANLPAKEFYQQLDDCYRTYFDTELNLQTLQSTADELMVSMKWFLTDEKLRTEFYQLVRLAAAVKFAKYIPDETRQAALNTVLAVADNINQYRIRKNAERVV
ncbi:hypothetical protein [Foetidibacter luteolus]|uniref:hypothetical protein n=1 Tax=Foetidibacter luteolus TaxID=2608880 RepID=UPI00129BF78B|nr:hypothetical protein [Foetidibacter luteolus]